MKISWSSFLYFFISNNKAYTFSTLYDVEEKASGLSSEVNMYLLLFLKLKTQSGIEPVATESE